MRRLLLTLFAGVGIIGALQAQTNRATTLQSARTVVVTDSKGQADHYSVTSSNSLLIQLKDGQLVFPDKTMDMADLKSMRLEIPQKFMLNEDSTTFTPYHVESGLLALRRTLLLNKWNSLVMPVSLTGRHILDAFGEGTLLATYHDIIETETEAQVNFSTIDLHTDEIVLQPGTHYLIRPTREPDIAVGATSTVNYGATRVPGPAYLLEGATMTTSNKTPQYKSVRSDQDNVRLRIQGSYTQREGIMKPVEVYVFNESGNFAFSTDSVAAKAFSSWIQVSRNNNETSLIFYVDGISITGDITGIADVREQMIEGREKIYDLQGRWISTLKRGLNIINGKKVYIR